MERGTWYVQNLFGHAARVSRLTSVTFAIAAAGTGGHVFPGLAVGEALVATGVDRNDILYVGGDRLESKVYPAAGFSFLRVDVRGLHRRLVLANLGIPGLVLRAATRIGSEFGLRHTSVVLGMGSYVSVPAGLAARRRRIPFLLHEQNAEAGLANRMMAPLAKGVFGSFPRTARLPRATWVGNPIRPRLAVFNRVGLRPVALRRYGLEGARAVVGIVGGSLGAGLLNEASEGVARAAAERGAATLHLTGATHLERMKKRSELIPNWRTIGFEEDMDFFYAACDLVVARAGGAVAELTATTTPSVLVPGRFGSGGHQIANARVLAAAGAAELLPEEEISRLPEVVGYLLSESERRESLARGCKALARPDAATTIAKVLVEMADG